MRKSYFSLLVLLFVSFCSFGQDGYLPLNSDKKIAYSDVATVEKLQNILYENAQKWVVKTFGNYQNAVVKEDKQSGKLVLNTYTPVASPSFEYLRFTMTIDCKDNKYLVTISDVEGISKSQSVTALGKRQNDEIQEKSVLVKTESNRKKKDIAEEVLNQSITDNEKVNQAIYSMLASLKLSMVTDEI